MLTLKNWMLPFKLVQVMIIDTETLKDGRRRVYFGATVPTVPWVILRHWRI